MMGAVCNDEKGEKLLESLKGVGVDISRIEVMNDIEIEFFLNQIKVYYEFKERL